MILLDTCALPWWTLDPDRLSAATRRSCNSIIRRGALVSSISFWEIGIMIKKKKLVAGISLGDYLDRVRSMGTVTIVPADENIWLAMAAYQKLRSTLLQARHPASVRDGRQLVLPMLKSHDRPSLASMGKGMEHRPTQPACGANCRHLRRG